MKRILNFYVLMLIIICLPMWFHVDQPISDQENFQEFWVRVAQKVRGELEADETGLMNVGQGEVR